MWNTCKTMHFDKLTLLCYTDDDSDQPKSNVTIAVAVAVPTLFVAILVTALVCLYYRR